LSAPRGTVPERRTGRILLAEDNATNRDVALAQLWKLGYQATAVTNGAEAVDAVMGGCYDLVLMDCQMPVMDGFEATRRIRLAHPGIPIVAITADAMRPDRDRCLREGMNDYLAKPVDLRGLANMLVKWLPARGAAETIQTPEPPAGALAVATFNGEALLGRLMGDRELAGVILKGFFQDVPSQLNNLRVALEAADAPAIRSQAHTLKGAAATVSAEVLRAVALEMERAGKTGQLHSCGELLPRAVEEIRAVQEHCGTRRMGLGRNDESDWRG
jgi:CheY-like chemotaxis protein